MNVDVIEQAATLKLNEVIFRCNCDLPKPLFCKIRPRWQVTLLS